jgi:putative hydrolase of the HAD superfamily
LEIGSNEEQNLVRFFETVLLEYPPVLIDGAAEAILHASQHSRVGLICDTGYSPGTTLRQILDKHQLLVHFHSFSFSNETGYLKPSAQCFQKILDDLQVAPDEAVHIGDLEFTDIKGAKEIGMKAVKYIGSNPDAVPESIADAVITDLKELPDLITRLM